MSASKPSEAEVATRRQAFLLAAANAQRVLKPGDRIRVTKCPGNKRWVTFAGWNGYWIVSKSGIDDFAPGCVDMVNGQPVNFHQPMETGQ